MYLTGGNTPENTPWMVAHIRVVHSDNTEILKVQ